MNRDVFAALADALDRGEPAALVTIVSRTGQRRSASARRCSCLATAASSAPSAAAATRTTPSGRRARQLRARAALVHYELNDDFAQETGLMCGGQMDVYIDPIEPSPGLYIVGAGHVGFHLARMAHDAGFRVHVVDDREKFANAERFPTRGDRRRRHPGVARSARDSRRTPTS